MKSLPEDNYGPNHSINTLSLYEKPTEYKVHFSFSEDRTKAEEESIAIFMECFSFLLHYIENNTNVFDYFYGIIWEILKNVRDHAGGKGYLELCVEVDPIFEWVLFHFVVGDFGPGIKNVAGSHENFRTNGFSTGTHNNHSVGGGMIFNNSAKIDLLLTLYDNDEVVCVNKPDIFGDYKREPKEKRWGQGAHFVGTLLLPYENFIA